MLPIQSCNVCVEIDRDSERGKERKERRENDAREKKRRNLWESDLNERENVKMDS